MNKDAKLIIGLICVCLGAVVATYAIILAAITSAKKQIIAEIRNCNKTSEANSQWTASEIKEFFDKHQPEIRGKIK
jgi:hypothetical protein